MDFQPFLLESKSVIVYIPFHSKSFIFWQFTKRYFFIYNIFPSVLIRNWLQHFYTIAGELSEVKTTLCA